MAAKGVQSIEITEETVDTGADPVLIFKQDAGTKKNKA
jgi:hypothetical protein